MQQVERWLKLRQKMRELALETTQALVKLDAERLETLADSCRVFERSLGAQDSREREELVCQAADAAGEEIGLLARVLQATRENMRVMLRAAEEPEGAGWYGPGVALNWQSMENKHGNN